MIYSTSNNEPALTDGHSYQQGEIFGMDTVAQVSSNTTFSALHLAPSTTYYFYRFSYMMSHCNNTAVYSADYISDSITTLDSVENLQKTTPSMIRLLQNPAQNNARLLITSSTIDKLELSILNIEGKKLLTKTIYVEAGRSTYDLGISDLSKACYVISGSFGNGKKCSMFLVKR